MRRISYSRQNISEQDIEAVERVLRSDWLTQGPMVKQFETAFADCIGSRYAVAVSSGTAALHLAMVALGVSSGSRIITAPITFAATANCVRYCGGQVQFADIDPETYLLDIQAVEQLIREHPEGTFSGVIAVDFAGRPVDICAFRDLTNRYGLWLVEDASHAPGAQYHIQENQLGTCGDCNFCDLATFSFHPVKHIAAGEGGMITTNDPALYKKLVRLRSHGIERDTANFVNSVQFASAEDASGASIEGHAWPEWYMEMQELGFNYRLSDIHAALGFSQLQRLDESLQRRRTLAERYHAAFLNVPQITDRNSEAMRPQHAFHLYVVEVEHRLALYRFLCQQGILTQIHYIPCHLMPYYRGLGWNEGDLPEAERYYAHCISLPMYCSLSDDDQDYVISAIKSFYSSPNR